MAKSQFDGRNYWDKRFRAEKRIWGNNPSISAIEASRIFKEHNLETILVPGCAYGRNSIYLAKEGFIVTAFDISPMALKTARQTAADLDVGVKYFEGNALDQEAYKGTYDGIYASNLLHLFLKNEREKIIQNLKKVLRKGGVVVLNGFSTEDASYGKGRLVEERTFYENDGHFAHYFAEEELVELFNDFKLIESKQIVEFENHGGKNGHFHNFLFTAFRKA